MTVTPKVLLACVAASSVFGGGIGALATAATQSQASPAAIAAAVQKVRDTAAEEKLTVIEHQAEATNKVLHQVCLNTSGNESAAFGC